MRARYKQEERMDEIRKKIIGLGASGQRKSYYPQLQEHIKELENANMALAQSEEKYRTLIENVDVGIFRTASRKASLVQANPALARMLGYDSVKELMAESTFDLFLDDDDRTMLHTVLARGEGLKRHKVRLRRRDGSWISGSLTLTAIRNAQGSIEWVDGVLVDITEQEASQRRIEEGSARLQATFDTLPVGIIMIDAAGQVVRTNERWLQIWAMDSASEAGHLDAYASHRSDREERLKEPESPLARAFRGEYIIDEEIDIQRFDGTHGTILSSAVPIRDSRGAIIGAVSTIIDITVRRKLESDLNEARSRAELYVDLLTHDISNYNAAAMGYLQLAEERFQLDDKDRKLIIRPLEELRNSTELVANVWDLQRVESGREKDEPVDVEEMLRRAAVEHSYVPGRDVAMTVHGGCGCQVMASELLSVVFSNLLSNAIKHSSGAVNVDVNVSTIMRNDREMARIEIEDDGPGVPDGRKEAIFDRSLMRLTKPVSRGLGLYLVKRLVGDYGGKVWVEDRVAGDSAQGARFVIELPTVNDGPAGRQA